VATARTLEKLEKLRIRPVISPWMAAYIVAAAVFGPFGTLLAKFTSRPTINAEGTNYMNPAFSAVGITLAALVMIPLGFALLTAVWGVLTQRTWAWTAGVVVLLAVAAAGLTAAVAGPIFKTVLFIVTALITWFWFREETREWYGV
jgi:uncharacterized Tic20 family protein